MVDVSSTKKRPAEESSTSSPSKKRNMALPGTGGNHNSDSDTGNPTPENAVIPRPLDSTGGFSMVFRKNHSLLSYGLGWTIFKLARHNRVHFTTTSLMEIPVDRPYLYMSPSEFQNKMS